MKRSVIINGLPTSFSLEDEFYDEIKRMAAAADQPINEFVEHAAAERDRHNISAHLRLMVVRDLRERAFHTKPTVNATQEVTK